MAKTKIYTPEEVKQAISNLSDSVKENVYFDLDLSKELKPKNQNLGDDVNENVLSIKDLHVYFKSHGHDNHVIRGISLDIKRGETFAIVGESGSGKSVFTKTLNGMNESNSKIKKGHIYLNNLKVRDPAVVKREFAAIDNKKDVLIEMKKRSVQSIKESSLKNFDKQTFSTTKKLVKEQNTNSIDVLKNNYVKNKQPILNKHLTFLDLYFTDLINKQLSKKAKFSLIYQKKTARFSGKANALMHSNEFAFSSTEVKELINHTFETIHQRKEYIDLVESFNKNTDLVKNFKSFVDLNNKEEKKVLSSSKLKLFEELSSNLTSISSKLKELYQVELKNLFSKIRALLSKTKNEKVNPSQHSQALESYMRLVDLYTEGNSFITDSADIIYNTKIDCFSSDFITLSEKSKKDYEDAFNTYVSSLEKNKESLNQNFERIGEQIKKITDSREGQRASLNSSLEEKLNQRIAENKLFLDLDIFSKEEKEFFKSFTKEDLNTIIATKLKLIELYSQKDKLISEVEVYKKDCLKAFLDGDKKKVEYFSSLLGLTVKPDFVLVDKLKQKLVDLEKDKLNRIKSLDPKNPTSKERENLIVTEVTAKKNGLERDIEATTNRIKNEIEEANIFDSDPLINIDREIFQTKNFVTGFSKVLTKIAYKKDMFAKMKRKGLVSNSRVDLSLFKTNKQWSMIRGSRIATIFQDPMTSLNPLISIGEQISEVLRIHHNLSRSEAKKEAISLLRKVKIKEPEKRYKEYPFQYSGGMRQRVVIAIALACRPDILICDEPTTALDVTVQSQILDLIKELQKDYHFTIIFITHDLGVVAGVADRIGVMYGGQIVEYGTDEDIFYRPVHPYTWALLSSLPQLAVADEPLTYIKGNPPSFNKEIIGDAFAPRSNYAMNIDFIMDPEMTKVSETHYAKTWLLDKRAPSVKKPAIIRNLEKRMQQTASEFLDTEHKGE